MKKLLSFILGICLIIPCAFLVTGCKDKEPEAKMETWDGTVLEVSVDDANAEGVITIDSAEKLAGVAAAVNAGETFEGKTIKLACDMDMANRTWTPIGVGHRSTTATPFAGTFDGNDHKIIGLNSGAYATEILAENHKTEEGDIKSSTVYTYHYGFFGYVTGATIKDLELTVNFNCNEANLKGDSVGGLVGYSSGALTITDCEVNGTINGGFDAVGGLVGRAYNSSSENQITITDCENNAEVTALYKAAGILGYVGGSGPFHATIDDCENDGTINSVGAKIDKTNESRFTSNVSGIVIYGWKNNQINTIIVTNCVNKGNLKVAENLVEEETRDQLHHFAYIATRVGNDFNGEYHSYKFENNSNEGKMYFLGEENSYVVCALVDNAKPAYHEEAGEYRYDTVVDEYNNKTNITA